MKTMHFKTLTEAQEVRFRMDARKKYKLYTPIDGLWHPVYQDECVKMNHENATFIREGTNP